MPDLAAGVSRGREMSATVGDAAAVNRFATKVTVTDFETTEKGKTYTVTGTSLVSHVWYGKCRFI